MAEREKLDLQAATAIYEKVGTPGAPHRLLARLAGSWTTQMKSWMEPGQPPMVSAGRCENKMILGGRYLLQEYTGDMMGTTFHGLGATGYDNHAGTYVSTWMDSVGTAILYFVGTESVGGSAFTQECRHDDPVRGPMQWRSVTSILDDNTHRFEMYITDRSGTEEQMMEINYTRKQG